MWAEAVCFTHMIDHMSFQDLRSARSAYLFMCLTLAWGGFAATGWLNRITGRTAVRGTHLVFATFAIAFGLLHAASFLFLVDSNELFNPLMLSVPPAEGSLLRWAPGIIGLELMIAIAITALLQHRVNYRKWLRFHQLGYLAVGLAALHSWLGAIAVGLALSMVVAGLGVLDSIGPGPRPATAPGVRPLATPTTATRVAGSTIVPTTSSPETYLTCGTATVVVIYRESGSGDPSGGGHGGHY